MKTQRVLLILLVAAGLLMISSSSPLDARGSVSVSSKLSGGQYVLTTQTMTRTQLTGYRLLDAAPAVDPAPGCCCKSYLPCVRK